MNIEQFFYENPIFTFEEFEKWKRVKKEIKGTSLHMALSYYVKNRKLLRLRRKLYAVVPPNAIPDATNVDSYLIAGKATDDSVLSFHTALELHGVAYSSFEQFTFFTSHKLKAFRIANQRYLPVFLQRSTLKSEQNAFGIEVISRQGVEIRMTNLARTYVDVLDRFDLSGGLEEVTRSLENIAALDIDEVIRYCLILNNSRLAAKVGYFLEQRKEVFAVDEEQLKPLLDIKPKAPQYLSKTMRINCQLNKKWNLMLPLSLLNKTWEEPDALI